MTGTLWEKEQQHISAVKNLIPCADDVENMHSMYKREFAHHADLGIHQNADPMNGQKNINSIELFYYSYKFLLLS